jgi:hypothetical protein
LIAGSTRAAVSPSGLSMRIAIESDAPHPCLGTSMPSKIHVAGT